MKSFREGLVAVVVVVGFMGLIGYDFILPAKSDAAGKATVKKTVKKLSAPAVMVEPQIFELAKKVTIDVMGKGFSPDQEVRLLLTDEGGMKTDVGYALKPELTINKSGAFFSSLQLDDFIKAKLVTAGAFALTVTDSDFKPLAEAYIFVKPAPKEEKKK